MIKSKLKKGDVVKIISGSHKGKQGPIQKLSKDKNKIYLEGVVGLRHTKPSQTDQEGGIKEILVPVHKSNVAIIDPKNKDATSRVGFQITDDKKVRIAKKSKAIIK